MSQKQQKNDHSLLVALRQKKKLRLQGKNFSKLDYVDLP